MARIVFERAGREGLTSWCRIGAKAKPANTPTILSMRAGTTRLTRGAANPTPMYAMPKNAEHPTADPTPAVRAPLPRPPVYARSSEKRVESKTTPPIMPPIASNSNAVIFVLRVAIDRTAVTAG